MDAHCCWHRTPWMRDGDGDACAACSEVPEVRRGSMAEGGAWPSGEYGSHVPPVQRDGGVPDRKDPVMHAVQVAGRYAAPDGLPAEAEPPQL
jgi:hypothetical protein